jgi:enoyl-CoA hydratase/carnithine racemase
MTTLEEIEWKRVLWDISDSGVLSITLNRPERLNAVSYRTLREIQWLIDHAGSNPDVRVVTLRGEGTQAFCTGDDLKGMNPEPGIDDFHVHHRLIPSIRELPKPVVALVNGFALGFGFELASACDFRLCADNIDVGDHRVTRSIGLIGGSTWFLPRIVGQGRALEILMTGRHLNAQEALDWGWANRVWPLDEFQERAAEYVNMLARLPTIATSVYKSSVEYSMTHGLRDSLAYEMAVSTLRINGTDDQREGRASWLEKRQPVFKGR